jgi:hypothetical protein
MLAVVFALAGDQGETDKKETLSDGRLFTIHPPRSNNLCPEPVFLNDLAHLKK